jgi:hypothetical protein
LGCAEEGLLKGLQCDDLRVHEDLAQRALHDSYSSKVSGSGFLDLHPGTGPMRSHCRRLVERRALDRTMVWTQTEPYR